MMKSIRTISRYIVGFVFIYSGFVKGIDPLGSAYKFSEYFLVAHLDFLTHASLVFSILQSAAEFIIGMALVLGLRMRLAAWGVTIFMSFFTLLTAVIALFNPVSDCGCFGDAIRLTNWQTFIKNLILMIFVLVVFLSRNQFKVKYKPAGEWAFLGIVFTGFLLVIRFCYFHLPVIDFLPYKTGTNIEASMSVPDGAPKDEWKTLLYYSKNGVTKEFNLENYPWQDTTWKFVKTTNILVKKGYVPPIHDFSIAGDSGMDITAQVLEDPGFSMIMVSHNLSGANRKALRDANRLVNYCATRNCNFYALTASPQADIDALINSESLGYRFYHTDETTLKTMIRSNPGFILLKEGVVIGKWSYLDMPQPDRMKGDILSYVLQYYRHIRERMTNLLLVLSLFLIMAIVKIIQLNFDRRG